MTYTLFGKQLRGRFGFPSGEHVTNPDAARLLLPLIKQVGFLVGKSTTIEPKEGNPEDIAVQETDNSLENAVGYTNPGLEATVEGFRELQEAIPAGVFLMPQIGESDEERFAYCAREFDKLKEIDGIEVNVSCGHAKKGGQLIGANPKLVRSVVSAVRKATRKPIIVKISAYNPLETAAACIEAGANGLSFINTLSGGNPELSNQFGGLSGAPLFPVLLDTARLLRGKFDVPMFVMGGIRGAGSVRQLDAIDNNFLVAIGTACAGMDLEHKIEFFGQLESDLLNGTDLSTQMSLNKMLMEYKPFVVRDIVELTPDLRLLKFYQGLNAGPGQFVFLKIGYKDGERYVSRAKPFSVANDENGLEIVVRRVGEVTSKIFGLQKNNTVRIRGPYGKEFNFPENAKVVYVGAGCGIAPVHHAARHHRGEKVFIVGTKNAEELVYMEQMQKMGRVLVSTDDGSRGFHGYITDLLSNYLQHHSLNVVYFFNCGPEVVMRKAEELELKYAPTGMIYHLVERMTSCGVGVCGKCSIPMGKLACVDGPVFSARDFVPGKYKRDKTGKKVAI